MKYVAHFVVMRKDPITHALVSELKTLGDLCSLGSDDTYFQGFEFDGDVSDIDAVEFDRVIERISARTTFPVFVQKMEQNRTAEFFYGSDEALAEDYFRRKAAWFAAKAGDVHKAEQLVAELNFTTH